MKRFLPVWLLALVFLPGNLASKDLEMWVVDTNGGKALLLLSPGGQSMLIDTGYPGHDGRDSARILKACAAAGVKKLDILVTTHYDSDHVGNTPALLGKISASAFYDHGAPSSAQPSAYPAYEAYEKLAGQGKHIVVKPGDKIPFDGVEVLVVASAGEVIKTPAQGAGNMNAACSGVARMAYPRANEELSENSMSVGLLVTFGKFRMLDLADLVWNKELDLMCPRNRLGTVDLFMASHHGNPISNSPALVHALHAKAIIMNNGPQRFCFESTLKTLKSAPGLEALYMLWWADNAPNDNPPDEYLANLKDSPGGNWFRISAQSNGEFVVANARTGQSKTFKK